MSKVLKAELSASSIDNLIQDINNYQKELNNKCETFIKRLSAVGIDVINARITSARGDSDKAHTTRLVMDFNGAITTGYVTLTGKDVLFIEFGAGIYYNNGNAHPKAAEFGYGVGTYPSVGHGNQAINPGYWWYKDDSGQKHFSVGTEATMPMYAASIEMIKSIHTIAREVFG